MRKILKWAGLIAGGLVALVSVLIAVAFITSGSKLNRTYTVPTDNISASTTDEAVANGEHLISVNCAGCHGSDLGGTAFLDDPMLGYVPAPNLTASGVGSTYADSDFERAIRHGINASGRPLLIMPSQDMSHFTDQDIADMIGYLRTVDAVDNDPGEKRLALGGRVFIGFGMIQMLSAELIDHDQVAASSIDPGVTHEYGAYLATGCTGCHGPDYAGGPMPSGPPDAPPAANLTPDAAGLGSWTEDDFVTAMRQGTRPDGSAIASDMPWESFGKMTDDELAAMWLYSQSLSPVETSNR